jgi:hypothetical protein
MGGSMERNESAIKQKLFELFMSKNKKPDPAVIAFWSTELKSIYPAENIIEAIERMKWSPDDFPTMGKIAEICREYVIDEVKHKIVFKEPEAIEICKQNNINIQAITGNPTALDRQIDKLAQTYMENKAKNKKAIENETSRNQIT